MNERKSDSSAIRVVSGDLAAPGTTGGLAHQVAKLIGNVFPRSFSNQGLEVSTKQLLDAYPTTPSELAGATEQTIID